MDGRLAPVQHDTLDGVAEPSENPHLFGHRDAAVMLATAYAAGKLPHALLFSGPRGIGKATLAFRLAHHLLAHPSARSAPAELAAPDPASSLWRQLAAGSHPAVLHLTRPWVEKEKKFKTVLSVDEIRRINRFLSLTSHDGSYRVAIVDPADDMSIGAANALLKNLEEPPSRTVFVLIAHSPGSLLPTIRSRCQTIRLQPLEPADLASALGGEIAPALAEYAAGSPRTAILFDRFGGKDIAEALAKQAAARAIEIPLAHKLADAVTGREQAIQFELFNDLALQMLADAAARAASAGEGARANRLSEAWHAARESVSETEAYNLDRKQHALSMIDRLNAALRM